MGRRKCVKKSSSISVIQSQLSFIYHIYTDGKEEEECFVGGQIARERLIFMRWNPPTRILAGSFANKKRDRKKRNVSLSMMSLCKEREGDTISLFLKFGTVGADLGSGFFSSPLLSFLYNSSSTPIKEEFSFLLQQPGGRLLIH